MATVRVEVLDLFNVELMERDFLERRELAVVVLCAFSEQCFVDFVSLEVLFCTIVVIGMLLSEVSWLEFGQVGVSL